jgi:hypothetical protein
LAKSSRKISFFRLFHQNENKIFQSRGALRPTRPPPFSTPLVRQLKHNEKTNKVLKAIKTSSINTNIIYTSQLKDTENNPVNTIVN